MQKAPQPSTAAPRGHSLLDEHLVAEENCRAFFSWLVEQPTGAKQPAKPAPKLRWLR